MQKESEAKKEGELERKLKFCLIFENMKTNKRSQ